MSNGRATYNEVVWLSHYSQLTVNTPASVASAVHLSVCLFWENLRPEDYGTSKKYVQDNCVLTS